MELTLVLLVTCKSVIVMNLDIVDAHVFFVIKGKKLPVQCMSMDGFHLHRLTG